MIPRFWSIARENPSRGSKTDIGKSQRCYSSPPRSPTEPIKIDLGHTPRTSSYVPNFTSISEGVLILWEVEFRPLPQRSEVAVITMQHYCATRDYQRQGRIWKFRHTMAATLSLCLLHPRSPPFSLAAAIAKAGIVLSVSVCLSVSPSLPHLVCVCVCACQMC